jgi:conjugal transfer mating pair stabilization protein TraN
MAVTMEAAREAGVYLTPNTADPRVFHGEGNKCSIKLSGIKNCCKAEAGARSNQSLLASATMGAGRAVLDYSFQKASGYMYDFFSKGNSWLSQKAASAFSAGAAGVPAASFSLYGITISYSAGSFAFAFDPASFALQVGIYLLMQWLACDEDETYLKMKKGANLCHYIGRYCSKKFLGYCFERKESYCCFNSRLARIINDQGRPQIGKGWGTAKNPECSGFTPAEFQGLDFSAMDLSEFIDEIMASVAHPEGHVGELINKQSGIIDQKVNDYFNP